MTTELSRSFWIESKTTIPGRTLPRSGGARVRAASEDVLLEERPHVRREAPRGGLGSLDLSQRFSSYSHGSGLDAEGMPASIPQSSPRSFPGFVGRPLLWRVVTEERRASMGRSGECAPCGGLSALLAEVEEGGFRRPTGLRPGVLHGRPSQAITTGAEMAAGEKRREVGRLSPMSTDVDIGATWTGVARMVALHRPVQVLLGRPEPRPVEPEAGRSWVERE